MGHRLPLGLSRSKGNAPVWKMGLGQGTRAPPAAAASPAGPTPRRPAYLGPRPRWWPWSSRNPSRRPPAGKPRSGPHRRRRSRRRRPRRRRRREPGTALAPPRAGTPTDPPVTAATAVFTNPQPPARSSAGHWWWLRGGGSLKWGLGYQVEAEGVVRSRITKPGMLTSLTSLRCAFPFLSSPPLSVPRMCRGEGVTGNICFEHCGCLSSKAKVDRLNGVQI